MIIGIDEVGRGSWAGPVCVAAVAWLDDAVLMGLADSKQLSAVKRQRLVAHIRTQAASIGIGWVSAAQIDRIGMSLALRQAALQALNQIRVTADTIIVDGRDKLLGDVPAEYIIKADTLIPAVMAASNIAKVARDTYMQALNIPFSQYKFGQHVGYGTALHKALLAEHGPCIEHRMSFAPLKTYRP